MEIDKDGLKAGITAVKDALIKGMKQQVILYDALEEAFLEAYEAAKSADQPDGCALPERDTTKPAEQQGIFKKFYVTRVDESDRPGGKHEGCEYFVLDVDHDAHAKPALTAYAESCKYTHPDLSKDMVENYGLTLPVRETQPDGVGRIGDILHLLRNPYGHSEDELRRARLEAADIIELRMESPMRESGTLEQRIIKAAIDVVMADSYVHPVLSRADAVKAGVAELHDAVNAYHSAQLPVEAK